MKMKKSQYLCQSHANLFLHTLKFSKCQSTLLLFKQFPDPKWSQDTFSSTMTQNIVYSLKKVMTTQYSLKIMTLKFKEVM